MFDGRFRHAVDRSTTPVGRALVAAGMTADFLTAMGLAMSVAAAVVIARGDFLIGVVLLAATGLPDLFDGPVAKAAGTTSVRGAFFDSVSDRVADAFLYGGVAWYLAAHGHGAWAVLPFAIMAATGLISYERAKAELLGLTAKGGLMERAERFIALGLCLIAAAVAGSALVPGLLIFLVLVLATAVGRFARVWRAATAAGAPSGTVMASGAGLRARTGRAQAAGGRAHVAAGGAAEAGAGAEVVGTGAALAGPARRRTATSAGVPASSGADRERAPLAGETAAALRWRRGPVDSRWRAWRAERTRALRGEARLGGGGAGPRRRASGVGLRRTGELSGRWRARRAAVPGSRVGHLWRQRGGGRARPRAGRRSGTGTR